MVQEVSLHGLTELCTHIRCEKISEEAREHLVGEMLFRAAVLRKGCTVPKNWGLEVRNLLRKGLRIDFLEPRSLREWLQTPSFKDSAAIQGLFQGLAGRSRIGSSYTHFIIITIRLETLTDSLFDLIEAYTAI